MIQQGRMSNPGSKIMTEINLTGKQVQQLLKLQQLFHSHYLTEQLLNEMIGLYVRFVENIQSNQNPLRIFFMQKIRFVLSRPEVIKILEKQSSGNTIRETMMAMRQSQEDEQLEMKKLTEEAKKQIQRNHVISQKKERNAAEHLKERERNLKIEMQMKIMEQVEVEMKQMNKQYKDRRKNNHINDVVHKQDQNLNQRRAKRKQKRKKSAGQKEIVVLEEPAPIAIEALKAVQIEVEQTFQRFTRLTQNRTRKGTHTKEGEARVTTKVEEVPIDQQLLEQYKKQQPKIEKKPSFAKKGKVEQVVETGNTTVEYQTFEQGGKRVTEKVKEYEQIEDEWY